MIDLVIKYVMHFVINFMVVLALGGMVGLWLLNAFRGTNDDDNDIRWRSNSMNGEQYYGREGEEMYHDMMNDDR